MSIKLKDTIYDLINKANKDGSGNVIVDTYLKKTGDYMSGDLIMMNSNQHNSDQYIKFKYSTTDLDGFSWRIGYTGTGDSNENRLVIQNNSNGSGGSSTSWGNVLTFGLFDKTAIFTNTPKVGSTKVSLEGHTHSQYLTELPSHNHNGSYLSLSNTQTPVVTNSQSGIVNFKSTNTVEAGIRILMGDVNKGGLWWISSSSHGMVIYNNTCSGYLGIKDNGTPHFNGNTLLHSNNWSSYAAPASHSHPYAGSSYAGGPAGSANKLNSVELSSGSLGSYYTEFNNYFAGGGNSISDKPSGVDAFGVLSMRTASGWYGQIMIASNLATGMYWRTGNPLSGGWRTVIDTSNYTTWCATSGHTHSNYSTTDHTHSNYYDYNVSRTANTVLAAPNGAAGSASFRKLVSADLPSHNHSASNITSGTLAVARGGTGQTTLEAACNSLINGLSTGSSNPTDNDYYVSQYAGGGTTYTTFHRRPVSALYNYIKGKLDSVYAAASHSHSGYASSSHSHSYLPLSGGTISNTSYGPLTIERSGSTNMAAIYFKNSSGILGSLGMNEVNGSLKKYDSSTSSYVTVIDSGNYTTWCAKKDHSHTITHAGTYWKMNDSSTNPYLQLVQGSTWYIQGYNGYLYLGAGSTNSVKINSSGGCDVKTLYINGEQITFTT